MDVIIGTDPHKRSATIEIVDERGHMLAVGRFSTDNIGYADMLAAGREHRDRCGRWRAVTASASTSPTGLFMTARRSWTCQRNCRRRWGLRHRQRPQD
jgi:hypothetical protein